MIIVLIIVAVIVQSSSSLGQANLFASQKVQDPGVRPGPAGSGQPIAGLTAGELNFFQTIGQPVFSEVESVHNGLGPRFNLNSCAGCHSYPAVGGSSPPHNPEFSLAAAMAPGNLLPGFISDTGPVREVRFVNDASGNPDGGVHDVFTITGRSDSPTGCAIQQPDFTNASNMAFRIPTPVFGDGLIESITDMTIRANLAADPAGQKSQNGIGGKVNVGFVGGAVNTNPNDGGITRFGWKAQNKSLTVFAGEAYNVEMGVTNEVFPNEREDDPSCATNATPESDTAFGVGTLGASDVAAFRSFMRFLAPPLPSCTGAACSPSIQNGHSLAAQIGCLTCHTETLTTGVSSTAALSLQPVNLYSDLAVHHMGAGLADGITQGAAGPDEFRSAPLWGLGQRLYFLHDGRTNDLLVAIKAHHSPNSEANQVIANFNHLSPTEKQDILNFLRSL
ncbi:MAG TPA: di-heme oxidoredictase family protein [Acidisarcina sp.]